VISLRRRGSLGHGQFLSLPIDLSVPTDLGIVATLQVTACILLVVYDIYFVFNESTDNRICMFTTEYGDRHEVQQVGL